MYLYPPVVSPKHFGLALFEQINDLIVALSHFAWPIVAIFTICFFRKEIANAINRTRRFKGMGNELELEQFSGFAEKESHSTEKKSKIEKTRVVKYPTH